MTNSCQKGTTMRTVKTKCHYNQHDKTARKIIGDLHGNGI